MSIVLIIFLRDSDPLYVKIVNNYVQVYSENTSMKTKVSIFKIGNLDYSKRVKTGGKRIHKNPTIFNSNTTNRSHLLESTDESSIHLEIFPTLFPSSSPSRLNCTTRASRRRRTRLEFRESRRFEGRSGFRVKPNKAGRNNRP